MNVITTVEKRDELDEALLEVGMSIQTGNEICEKAMDEANDMDVNVHGSQLIVIILEDDPADVSMTEFELLNDEDNPAV